MITRTIYGRSAVRFARHTGREVTVNRSGSVGAAIGSANPSDPSVVGDVARQPHSRLYSLVVDHVEFLLYEIEQQMEESLRDYMAEARERRHPYQFRMGEVIEEVLPDGGEFHPEITLVVLLNGKGYKPVPDLMDVFRHIWTGAPYAMHIDYNVSIHAEEEWEEPWQVVHGTRGIAEALAKSLADQENARYNDPAPEAVEEA